MRAQHYPVGDDVIEPLNDGSADDPSLGDLLGRLRGHLWLLMLLPIAAAALGVAASYLVMPRFTATTTFLAPQQSQGAAAAALGSLGSLAQLAGGSINVRSSADQLVALMQSTSVSDQMVQRFKLMESYDEEFRVDARKKLAKNVRFTVGKKDGLVIVEVDDTSPGRAAEMANRYVEELRLLTSTLAVTEAQQRRQFFEQLLKETRDRLVSSQQALQASGFNPGALKAEPKTAADAYARLRAEATTAEVRLQTLRGSLADSTPEVRQQLALLSALREQLARSEQPSDRAGGSDYVGKYREFKYQETLFELYARQFELARVDESREGALIQVVDVATPPEKKSWPRRSMFGLGAALGTLLLLLIGLASRGGARLEQVGRMATA